MIYTVTLNPAIDYVIKLNTLTEGALHRPQDTQLQFGGKGINVSFVLRELDAVSCALGFAAGFTGRALQEELLRRGIQEKLIFLPEGNTRINVKLKTQKENQRIETEINAAGPRVSENQKQQLLKQLDALHTGDVLVLSGSVPQGISYHIYEEMLERLRGKGILSVVDAHGELLRQSLHYHPFLVKPNLQELEELWGEKITDRKALLRAAESLKEQGACNVLVSLGSKGALLLTENQEILYRPAPEGKLINSVGAGDSMTAGFLAEYLRTKDYALALKMGIAAGSATAFSEGLAEKKQIQELFQQL